MQDDEDKLVLFEHGVPLPYVWNNPEQKALIDRTIIEFNRQIGEIISENLIDHPTLNEAIFPGIPSESLPFDFRLAVATTARPKPDEEEEEEEVKVEVEEQEGEDQTFVTPTKNNSS